MGGQLSVTKTLRGLGSRDDHDTALPLKELKTEAKATR